MRHTISYSYKQNERRHRISKEEKKIKLTHSLSRWYGKKGKYKNYIMNIVIRNGQFTG